MEFLENFLIIQNSGSTGRGGIYRIFLKSREGLRRARLESTMQRIYKTRSDILKKAIDALDAGFSLRQVAAATGIPKTTLLTARAGKLKYLFDGVDIDVRSIRKNKER